MTLGNSGDPFYEHKAKLIRALHYRMRHEQSIMKKEFSRYGIEYTVGYTFFYSPAKRKRD